FDHAFRIVRSGKFMHLRKSGRRTFQVRCRGVNVRSRHQVCVNPTLDFQVGVRLQAPRRTHCGHASRQIESWRRVRDLGNEQSGFTNPSVDYLQGVGVGVVKMVVHSNQTRDDRVARAPYSLRTRRDLGGLLRTDGLYFAIRDYDRLVLLCRRTRTIDDSDMPKNEDWSIDADEVRYATRLLCLRNGDRGKEQ